MKLENVIKNLEKKGYIVNYERYKYWDNIPQVNNTFLVLDSYYNNSHSIDYVSSKLTLDYILACIKQKKINLGYIDHEHKAFLTDSKKWNLHKFCEV